MLDKFLGGSTVSPLLCAARRCTAVLLVVLATPTIPAQSTVSSLYADLAERSYPPRYDRVSLFNPWGEDLIVHREWPADFGDWVVAAAQVYADQKIRFDGYMGSTDDGSHYTAAADGEDGAWWGDSAHARYNRQADGVVDDLGERVWICLDLPVHAFTLAGYPIREALARDFEAVPEIYTIGGTFSENVPTTQAFFRRVRNLRTFLQRHQKYAELRVRKEQYRDPDFRPVEPFAPGDLVFFGHYGDPDGTGGVWHPKHSGIVGTVDARGLPVVVYNMRVSQGLIDEYDGKINQTRVIEGREVHFERFADRYSLIGFGRIVHPFVPDAAAAGGR